MNRRPTHGWCPACEEESAIDAAGNCLWCEGPTKQRRRGGWKRPDLVARAKLTDDELRTMHRLHREHGFSQRELGRRIFERKGFATAKSAAMQIGSGWKRLGLAAIPREEMTARANRLRRGPDSPGTEDRAAYKRWLRERAGGNRVCAGVKLQSPRKGSPCTRYALVGSDFCLVHDPARREQVVALAAEMRRLLPV